MNFRRIARHPGIHHRMVALWAKAAVARLPEAPVPQEVQVAEMDELFTLYWEIKKQDLHSKSHRPEDALLSELESGPGAHTISHSSARG